MKGIIMAEIISLIGIIVGIAVLIVLVFRGLPMLIVAPIAAFVVALISRVDLLESMTVSYMTGFTGFALKNFFIFFLSAIFGRMMGDSGAAKVIAYKFANIIRKAPPKKQKVIVVLSFVALSLFFTLGGISSFVVVFTLVPLARQLFEEMNVPWRFYTCSYLGSGVLSMTMLPGSPSIHNILPTTYLGTTTMAAPLLGILSAILAATLGISYINALVKKSIRNGEGFMPSGTEISKLDLPSEELPDMSFLRAIAPSFVLLFVMNVIKITPVTTLLITVVVASLLFTKELNGSKLASCYQNGANNAVGAIISACSAVGFGAVASSVSGYQLVINSLNSIPGPPIVQLIIAVNITCGITGSASGGLGIAMEQFSQRFVDMNINPQIIHRIACISCGGLDSLPHNTGIVNDLQVCRLTHRQGYLHYGVLTVIIPLITCVFAAILSSFGIC